MSLRIFWKYDKNSSAKSQYELESQSYLAATIIKYIFAIKIPLFLFFIFTLDKLSGSIVGAMCAAGVVDATDYGTPLLMLKILNLYLFAYWIVLHNEDSKDENQPYVREKFAFYCVAFFLFIGEIVLEFVMFDAIDIKSVVDCCGVIYSSSSASYLSYFLNMNQLVLLTLFYTLFLLMFLFYKLKNRYAFTLVNLFFIIVSLITLISFFGTYIYELPTHKCPFCFLQKDYHYIGYILYAFLFLGTFYGLTLAFKEREEGYKLSLFFNSAYTIGVSIYPALYYFKNGVWL
ncbi:MAG: hypothetical protein ABIJ02_02100 [Pseudomonadota bacterium]